MCKVWIYGIRPIFFTDLKWLYGGSPRATYPPVNLNGNYIFFMTDAGIQHQQLDQNVVKYLLFSLMKNTKF